jgi:hypothetical protein
MTTYPAFRIHNDGPDTSGTDQDTSGTDHGFLISYR